MMYIWGIILVFFQDLPPGKLEAMWRGSPEARWINQGDPNGTDLFWLTVATLWLFNVAMENGWKWPIYRWFTY
jgi:hypothetical protein